MKSKVKKEFQRLNTHYLSYNPTRLSMLPALGLELFLYMVSWISAVSAVYIIYMFNFFQTRINFNLPFNTVLMKSMHEIIPTEDRNVLDFITHTVTGTTEVSSICPFGGIIAYIIAIAIIVGDYYPIYPYYRLSIATIILIVALIMNANAFVYLLPVYFVEIIRFASRKAIP